MQFEKESVEQFLRMVLDTRNHSFKWQVNYQPHRKFVVDSFWINENTLQTIIGRVDVPDIKWMLLHELAHYEVADDMKYFDNFGLPRDDMFFHSSTKLTHIDVLEIEKKAIILGKELSPFLSNYEANLLINMKI